MSLNYSEIQEVFGRVRVQAILEPFFGPPPFVRKVIQALIDHCEVPSKFALNSPMRSSNRIAPSSSRGIDGSCRSNLIMGFDTARQC